MALPPGSMPRILLIRAGAADRPIALGLSRLREGGRARPTEADAWTGPVERMPEAAIQQAARAATLQRNRDTLAAAERGAGGVAAALAEGIARLQAAEASGQADRAWLRRLSQEVLETVGRRVAEAAHQGTNLLRAGQELWTPDAATGGRLVPGRPLEIGPGSGLAALAELAAEPATEREAAARSQGPMVAPPVAQAMAEAGADAPGWQAAAAAGAAEPRPDLAASLAEAVAQPAGDRADRPASAEDTRPGPAEQRRAAPAQAATAQQDPADTARNLGKAASPGDLLAGEGDGLPQGRSAIGSDAPGASPAPRSIPVARDAQGLDRRIWAELAPPPAAAAPLAPAPQGRAGFTAPAAETGAARTRPSSPDQGFSREADGAPAAGDRAAPSGSTFDRPGGDGGQGQQPGAGLDAGRAPGSSLATSGRTGGTPPGARSGLDVAASGMPLAMVAEGRPADATGSADPSARAVNRAFDALAGAPADRGDDLLPWAADGAAGPGGVPRLPSAAPSSVTPPPAAAMATDQAPTTPNAPIPAGAGPAPPARATAMQPAAEAQARADAAAARAERQEADATATARAVAVQARHDAEALRAEAAQRLEAEDEERVTARRWLDRLREAREQALRAEAAFAEEAARIAAQQPARPAASAEQDQGGDLARPQITPQQRALLLQETPPPARAAGAQGLPVEPPYWPNAADPVANDTTGRGRTTLREGGGADVERGVGLRRGTGIARVPTQALALTPEAARALLPDDAMAGMQAQTAYQQVLAALRFQAAMPGQPFNTILVA